MRIESVTDEVGMVELGVGIVSCGFGSWNSERWGGKLE